MSSSTYLMSMKWGVECSPSHQDLFTSYPVTVRPDNINNVDTLYNTLNTAWWLLEQPLQCSTPTPHTGHSLQTQLDQLHLYELQTEQCWSDPDQERLPVLIISLKLLKLLSSGRLREFTTTLITALQSPFFMRLTTLSFLFLAVTQSISRGAMFNCLENVWFEGFCWLCKWSRKVKIKLNLKMKITLSQTITPHFKR